MRAITNRFRLVSWESMQAGDRPVAPSMASGWLAAWITDPACRAEVLDLFTRVANGTRPGKGWFDSGELHQFVRPRLQRALDTGELVLVERVVPRALPQLAEPGPAPEAPAPSEKPKPTKTWIEFEVLDADGKAIADEPWEAHLPDGSVKKGKTDSKGIARFEDLDPGVCQFTLVDRDGDTWKSTSEPIVETDFLEFELVDEDDSGIPDEAWELKLGDGKKQTGATDIDGHVRLESLTSGKVELTFTDLDGGSWKKL